MGNALQDLGKPDKAIDAFKTAISINPKYAEAYNNIGVILQETGKLDEAVATYTKAISLRHDYAEAYYNIGNSLGEQGKLKEAIKALKRAISIRSDYAEALVKLGKFFRQLEQVDESLKYFEQALGLDPEDTLGVELELVLLGQKNTPPKTPQNYMTKFYKKKSNKWGKGKSYSGHILIQDAFNSVIKKQEKIDVLDLGCGTGTLASFLRPFSKNLDGVDLSPDMIKLAKSTGVYDSIYEQEIETYLAKISNQYDVVLAAAVFIHFFDLYNVFFSDKEKPQKKWKINIFCF